jgi:LysM repeat protein
LWGIGIHTHRTWQQLASYNHTADPNQIVVGQVITIPPATYRGWVELPVLPAYTPPVRQTRTSYTPSVRPVVRSYSSSYSGGGFTGVWACIAQHESGGNPGENTGNGYYGGLQFSVSTWHANGGSGNPADASVGEQQRVAETVVAASGGSYGAWPNTSRMCGM